MNEVRVPLQTCARAVMVHLGDRSYVIHVERGALKRSGELLREVLPSRRAVVVTHQEIERLYGDLVRRSLEEEGFEWTRVLVPPGDETKSLIWAERLWDSFVDFGLKRNEAVLALGGGVVGDLAGFAAATYMRGVPFVQAPTTLLAQVDSSVGGKVAINHPRGKNLVGAFHQPVAVLIDPSTLATLPDREFRAGLAEVIKYGVIADSAIFGFLETNMPAILRKEEEALLHVLVRSCEIKAAVVSQDEREGGLREILNYGHTVGHAIEAALGYRGLLHGEAVAIGMSVALRLAERRGLVDAATVSRQDRLLEAAGLPHQMPRLKVEQLLDAMKLDKKARGGSVRFALPTCLGNVQPSTAVDLDLVAECIESVMEG